MSKTIALLSLLFSSSVFATDLCSKRNENFSINTAKISLEVVCSQEDKAKGLMEREQLGENKGMLFVFENEQILNFWMKNTKIPLDIIFLNDSFIVVSEAQMKPYDLNTTSSKKIAKYAVELDKGFIEKYKVKAGDKLIKN